MGVQVNYISEVKMGHKTTKNNHKVKAHKTVSCRIDFFYYAFRNILLVSVPLLTVSTLILGLSVSRSSATTNLATDNFTLSIPISCTLTASIKAGEEHSISMVSGQYKADIGKTTMDTTCNDPNGFVVYAIGSSNNEQGNNKLKALTLSDMYDIVSGTAESGNTSNWAMKLTPISNGDFTPTIDNNFTQYSIVPNTWTKIAHKNPGTTDITKKTSFTTTYAVYLESTQPAGTYRGQVKYVMFHPSTAAEPTDTIEHAFALAGKSKVQVTDPVTGQSGSFYKMQDMTTNICESTTLVDEQNTLQLVDIRDNKLYWVTKLQDGHCWMTQNLDLDLGVKDTALGIDTTVLTSEDTDLTDHSLTGAYYDGYIYNATTNTTTWTPTNITYSHADKTGIWDNDDNTAYSMDPGNWYRNNNKSTQDCNFLATTCEDFSQIRTDINERFSVGNYYNWSAAVASDNTSALNASTYNDPQNNPQNSICPKGWRLPVISSQKLDDFSTLKSYYPINNFANSPLYLVRTGIITSKTPYYSGANAYYWSSTVLSKTASSNLLISGQSINPRSQYLRYLGMPIRCLAH